MKFIVAIAKNAASVFAGVKLSDKKVGISVLLFFLISSAVLSASTYLSLAPLPEDLARLLQASNKTTYYDRYGKPLNVTYQNPWNSTETLRIHEVPQILQESFVVAEDKRFYQHSGVDWVARMAALSSNVAAGKAVRGASTISEQVVRILHPRPRTLWSRWVEGFDANRLEARFSKTQILEFYLNQVPYGAQRRGIAQASQFYFGRDISTLNHQEMLALAVIVRAPRWYDPKKQKQRLQLAVVNLAARMGERGVILSLSDSKIHVKAQQWEQDFSHFIRFVEHGDLAPLVAVHTSLDRDLQKRVQSLLDRSLQAMKSQHVENGSVLVVDHIENSILAWVVGGANDKQTSFGHIDGVLAKRQPGSTLKPLLYALALQKGWTAATLLDDSPLEEGVGAGLHSYQNYSREYYGWISLREALGNSLNIPAIRTLQFVGATDFLEFLNTLGIESLQGHPNVYGDGVALGNGEISLYEMVQAYSILGRMGRRAAFHWQQDVTAAKATTVIPEDVASLVAHILSDPAAREKEFGWDSVLNFPHQTAVKTGTSSDYRDAWALGFNDRYTVGVWMGNLDYREMQRVTGSKGPARVLRSVFNHLNKNRDVRPLYFSPYLEAKRICITTGLMANGQCAARDEWFLPGTEPVPILSDSQEIKIRKPSPGLMLAMDPRIEDDAEYFQFALNNSNAVSEVIWYVNNQKIGVTDSHQIDWKVTPGNHLARADVLLKNGDKINTEEIPFIVF